MALEDYEAIPFPTAYGYIRDEHDLTDHMYQPHLSMAMAETDKESSIQPLASYKLPTQLDLPQERTFPVYDQSKLGSCTANASAFAYRYLTETTDPSRLFIFYNGRGFPKEKHQGCSYRDCLRQMAERGVCQESLWPYTDILNKFKVKPTTNCYEDAQKQPHVMDYKRIAEFNESPQIDKIKTALFEGYPVLFAFVIYNSFLSAKAGVVAKPEKEEKPRVDENGHSSSHAVCIVGYDDNKKYFTVRNSWGEQHGDKGYYYFPYDFITDTKLCFDFWIIDKVQIVGETETECKNNAILNAYSPAIPSEVAISEQRETKMGSNEDKERLEWNIGSRCSVYSRTNNQWLSGYIHNIIIDDDNKEWFIVKYGNNKKKSIQRFSKALKPKQDNDDNDDKENAYEVDEDNDDNENAYEVEEEEDNDDDEKQQHNFGYSKEKILFRGLFGPHLADRREKIITAQNKRVIVQCIGRIESVYEPKMIGISTGTVFHYDNTTNNVYVITTADGVITTGIDNDAEKPESVRFQRIITYKNKPPEISANYLCNLDKSKYDEKYLNGSAASHRSNNLAVLVFKDDGFYRDLFKNNKDAMQLLSINSIQEPKTYEYSIYGYPATQSRNSCHEMWGMSAFSRSFNEKMKIEMYVKLNTKKTMFYYNAIDTGPGQGGSAIFIEIAKDKYGIVGVHTGGSIPAGKKWGLALNDDKLKWIDSVTKQ